MKINNAAVMSRLRNGRFLAGIVGALAILGFLLIAGSTPSTHAVSPDIAFVAIDMNTAGNNTVSCAGEGCAPGTIGAVQTCAEVDPGSTVNVDIVVSGVPNVVAGSGAGPNLGTVFTHISYNPAIAKVSALPASGPGGPPGNLGMMYAGTPGGTHFFSTDSTPDTDGDFGMTISDGGVHESGPGILIRLTLQGVAPGISSLGLSPFTTIADAADFHAYTIGSTAPSMLAVHPSTCPAAPTPGSVGGIVALAVSSSGSSIPWSPLAAVAAAVMAVFGVGFWYGRKRWAR